MKVARPQVSLCGFWLVDGWKRASPIQILVVSQAHCLILHFSGKAVASLFLFGPVHGVGYMCSPCFRGLGEKAEKRKEGR